MNAQKIMMVILVGLLGAGCTSSEMNRPFIEMPPVIYPSLTRPVTPLATVTVPARPTPQTVSLSETSVSETASQRTSQEIPERTSRAARRWTPQRTSGLTTREENQHHSPPLVVFPAREVYISSARLSRSYMTEAIKVLEQAGYTITTRSKGALRLRISFTSVREGGSGILSGRYRVRGGIRSRVYFCSAFLTDPDGRVVARGEGESLHGGNYRIPLSIGRKSGGSQTFGLRWGTSTSEAKAAAALKAVTEMLQNRRVVSW